MPITAPITVINPIRFEPIITLIPVDSGTAGGVTSQAIRDIQFSVTSYPGGVVAYDVVQKLPDFKDPWVVTSDTPAVCTVSGSRVTKISNGEGIIRLTGPYGFIKFVTVTFAPAASSSYLWTGFSGVSNSSKLSDPILALLTPARQKNYFSSYGVKNPNCWAAPLDLTGSPIATSYGGLFGTANSGALITPQHWVGVSHWGSQVENMGPGATISCVGIDGIVYTRTVVQRLIDASRDRVVSRLDSPFPATVRPLKLAGATMLDTPNQRMLGMGWQVTQEKNITPIGFDDLSPDYKSLRYSPTLTWDSEFVKNSGAGHRLNGLSALLQKGRPGDSGGAIGGYYNGETYLVSLFTGEVSGYLYSETQASELNAIISSLDAAQGISTGYQVGVLNVILDFPTTLPNLWAYYDAKDSSTLYDSTTGGALVALGSPVARVNDKSGNGRHLTQTDPTKRPLRSAIGISSDNINDRLEVARSRTSAYTLCVRMRLKVFVQEVRYFNVNYTFVGVQNGLAVLNEAVAWGQSGLGLDPNTLITVTIIRSSASYAELRLNGATVASISNGQAGDADPFLALMKGEYSRVVLTESALSGTQLTDLETYIAA